MARHRYLTEAPRCPSGSPSVTPGPQPPQLPLPRPLGCWRKLPGPAEERLWQHRHAEMTLSYVCGPPQFTLSHAPTLQSTARSPPPLTMPSCLLQPGTWGQGPPKTTDCAHNPVPEHPQPQSSRAPSLRLSSPFHSIPPLSHSHAVGACCHVV